MQDRQYIFALLKASLPELQRDYGVRALGVFGSFARDEANQKSDLDILAEFERPIGLRFMEFTERLEKIVQRPVDVLTGAGVTSIRQPDIAQSIRNSVIYV